jgi:amino acid adenylation domain-containing protein
MRPVLIQEMFQQAVERFGHDPAITSAQGRLTYLELDEMSNNLANFLLAHGAVKGSLIGIMVEDPVAIVAAIIAILKISGVYIPLDASLPDPRLSAMIEQVRPAWFITESKHFQRLDSITVEIELRAQSVITDDADAVIQGAVSEAEREGRASGLAAISGYAQYHNLRPIAISADPEQMCYVYFTSGSTGKPKGIAGRLKGIDHFIRWEMEALKASPGIRVSQLLPLTFDGSVRDIFLPLCAGGVICVPDNRQMILDARQLIRWLDEQEINLVHCVPSLFRALINEGPRPDQLKALRQIVMAGEAVLPADVSRWTEVFGERVQLVNLYGTSETTLAKFYYFIRESDKDRPSVPIGKPMPGARALVLDERKRVCPQGTVGEIYIRTPFRSLGYINQSELTNEVFLKNPLNDDPLDIVYKTGDLGRVMEDGNFEFIGRKDQQVKVRGVRIELGEIESLMLRHEAVRDVAVIDREDTNGNRYLCAYVVAEGSLNGELREWVAGHLPDYMVPSAFVVMDKLPRTLSGKIDRRSLPTLDEANESREYVAPETAVQEVVAGIWSEVLGLKRVGLRDNFFELGGHSLLATQVISRIREALEVDIPLSGLFEGTTVEKLSRLIVAHEPRPGQAEKVAEILKRINSLTAEETRSMLQQNNAKGTN